MRNAMKSRVLQAHDVASARQALAAALHRFRWRTSSKAPPAPG